MLADPSVNGESSAPAASREEAAAIVAALERFMRETAAAAVSSAEAQDPWRRAALLEGVRRFGAHQTPEPWINV